MSFDCIPDEMKSLNQWVCAREGSKVPFMSEILNMAASSTNPGTWSSFEAACEAVKNGWYDYVGFVFNDNGLVGIDIDQGYDDAGDVSDLALDVILSCASYTERSRSGRGFHIIVQGDMPIKGHNNRKGLEIYKTGRYFIMTGDAVLYTQIHERQTAIDYVLCKYCVPDGRPISDTARISGKLYTPRWEMKPGRLPCKPNYPQIGEGSRNVSLLSLGGALVSMGCHPDAIWVEMVHVNKTACVPPLSEKELKAVFKSVMRYKR